MSINRLDPSKPPEEVLRTGAETKVAAPPRANTASGGKVWVPVIANILLMPAIAYALTTFVLIPKIQGGRLDAAAAVDEQSYGKGAAKSRTTVPLGGKVLVNVAGTAGTRYLVAAMTLVGNHASFKQNVELNDPQLRDAAASILGGKTISDLEKPGTRNVIRAELISAFNDILGREAVVDIYLTEFAIQ